MRRNQRKPWPHNTGHIYYEIRYLARMISRHLLDIQTKAFDENRDHSLVHHMVPVIRLKARQIQNACYAYDAGKQGRPARWAGWVIEEIDILAGAIIRAMTRTEQSFADGLPHDPLIRRMVRDALELAPLIEKQLNAGPAPRSAKTPVTAEVDALAGNPWSTEAYDD